MEPCARTVPCAILSCVAFLEKAGSVPHGQRTDVLATDRQEHSESDDDGAGSTSTTEAASAVVASGHDLRAGVAGNGCLSRAVRQGLRFLQAATNMDCLQIR